jgi:uncharacterized membrane protein HdeD (DUF308 family)
MLHLTIRYQQSIVVCGVVNLIVIKWYVGSMALANGALTFASDFSASNNQQSNKLTAPFGAPFLLSILIDQLLIGICLIVV